MYISSNLEDELLPTLFSVMILKLIPAMRPYDYGQDFTTLFMHIMFVHNFGM
mgnify:CR=1 FL=1